MASTIEIPVAIMRGGTSRALVFRRADLPAAAAEQDAVLRAAMGSPDPAGRQTDGLGGGHPLTSKVAIVGPSADERADIDFTFAQVDVTGEIVDRSGNCGNISSVVAPFALAEGMVERGDGETPVRVRNTNTDKIIHATVATGAVPGEAERVVLAFQDPGGSRTGKLLPTGAAAGPLDLAGGGAVEVSIVDAGNPFVFVRMADLGVAPDSAVAELEADAALLGRLEEIRAEAAVRAGLAASPSASSPAVPKIAMVGPGAGPGRIVVRALSMGRVHRAFQLTGGVCVGAAAAIPGTLVAAAAAAEPVDGALRLTIEHPSGTMEVAAGLAPDGRAVAWVAAERTARRLCAGTVYVPDPKGG